MSGLRSDMSGLGQICPVWGSDLSGQIDLVLWKSKSGAKTMNLRPDKLNTIELREIKGTTRSNLNTRNHT
jgi:hypothetical protein